MTRMTLCITDEGKSWDSLLLLGEAGSGELGHESVFLFSGNLNESMVNRFRFEARIT